MRRAAVIDLVGCVGSSAVIGWIPRLLRLVVKTETPCSAAWFGSEDAEPMLPGEETDACPPGSGEPSRQVDICLCFPPDRT